MAITASSKILSLLLLYFVQGIPYGFQARFLPIFLRTHGMSLTSLGFFKILLFPWMLKVLWSPWLDRYGTRHQCIIWSLIAMTTICGAASCISPDQTVFLCIVITLLNLAASTQDIAVDGIAIQILSNSELGAGNTVQVVGYKIGSILGGGALVWLIEFTGWSGLCILLSLFYAVTVIVVIQLDELKQCSINQAHYVDSDSKAHCEEMRTRCEHDPKLQSISSIVWQVVSTPHTKWTMFFVVFYKLGEQGAVSMFPLYLVDHGIPASEVGIMTGVIGQGLSIAGSLAGGWVLSNPKMSLTPSVFLSYLLKLRIIPIVLQATIICYSNSDSTMTLHDIGIAALCLLQLIGGAVTTSTFTLMMQCSQYAPQHIQATHYTALATLEVIGKLMFASVAGWLVDWLGYATVFWVFVGLSLGILAVFRPWVQKSLL